MAVAAPTVAPLRTARTELSRIRHTLALQDARARVQSGTAR